MDDGLKSWLQRARRRWLIARALDAGGRWAMLPAATTAIAAGALLIVSPREQAAIVATCAAGVAGALATVAAVGWMHAKSRSNGAPDWVVALDHHFGLQDQLSTLTEGAGAFAPVLAARLAPQIAQPPARAFPLRTGSLAVALLLALLPLGLIAWQPPQALSPDQVAATGGNGGGAGETPAPGKQRGEPKEGTGGGGNQPQEGPGKASPRGDQPTPQGPSPEQPPDVNPEPANSGDPGEAPIRPKETKPPEPPPKVDSRDMAVKPDAGEGDRRAEERRRWIYDENGKPIPGAEQPGAEWKSRAEEAIPRLKLTSRERKLLEDWFRQLGGG